MKRTIALLLSFALCLGLLSGCGKTNDKETEAPNAESEEVYTSAFRTISLPEESWLQSWALDGDTLYLAVHEKLAEGEIPEGVTPEFEGQFDTFGTRLYRVGGDGALTELPFELPDGEPDGGENAQETVSHSLMKLYLHGGELLALRQDWRSWFAGPAGMTAEDEEYWNYMRSESSYSLLRLNEQGALLDSAELTLPPESEYGYLGFDDSVLDGEGRLYVTSDAGVYVFDSDGEPVAQIESDDWVNELVCLPDGRVLAMVYGMRGVELRELDADRRGFGLSYALDDSPNRLFPGSGEWDLLYTGGTWLCGYSLAEQRSERLVELLSCDILADELMQLAAAPDGSLRGLCWDRGGSADAAPALVTLSRVLRASVPEHTVLSLGTLSPDAVSRAVRAFNRSQDQVRIELRDYSDLVYNSMDAVDYEHALTKLATEIMSGKMPDLLMLEGLPYRQLAVKGLLEDLYPYLDADAELSRADLFGSVLRSMEVDGGLYEVSPSFSLITLMGASSVVGDTPGWTYDELNAALAQMPEGCTVLGPYTGRDEMLSRCVYLELDRLVNWETGECRFDSEDFVKLLEFAGSFPAEISYEGDGSENAMTRIASGKQMLAEVSIYDLDELCFNEQIFGGEATYIGYPTSEGVGNLLYANDGVAMSSRCADKEAAWQFLRQFLTAEYEAEEYGGLPLNRACMDERIARAMEVEYERDENGNYKLDPDTGERIPLPKGGMGMSMGGDAMMEFTLWPMTERQRDELLSLIENSTRFVDMDTHIYGIVREEAESYFAGQRSVEETARLIQSKVKLYVNEQR